MLELKTKTVNIDHLLNFTHNRKTIMAWSLNTFRIVKSRSGHGQYSGLAGSGVKMPGKGLSLAFHFDPLYLPGLRSRLPGGYRAVV
ncbi:MAG: hypothetical protein R2860_12635 [Desulfobacterales bacterium]